jgi:hypothetical protein
MAGPAVVDYLAKKEYADFHFLVRQYAHDVANRLSPIMTECEIIGKVLEKTPPEEVIAEESLRIQAEYIGFEAGQFKDSLKKVNEFFWPQGDTEGINRGRWQPFDSGAWDQFIESFQGYLDDLLEKADPLFDRVGYLEHNDKINKEGRARTLVSSCLSIYEKIDELENMFDDNHLDSLMPEWVARRKPEL